MSAYQLRRSVVGLGLCLFLAILTASLGGCSRTDYRLRADAQTYAILEEKSEDPRWSVPDFDLEPDPRSRFYDPYDPDCPPLPPDDPAAHQYMQCVYGMRGWKHWNQFGEIPTVENPDWPTFFGGDPLEGDNGPLPGIDELALEAAMEVGLIHSRDYHEQLENVYLTALSLTYQRYRFDVRPLGYSGEPGTELFYEYDGEDGNLLQAGPTTLGISKLMPAGGQFVAELANNTLWLASGSSGGTQTASTLAFSLVQPLLAGAGREIALENLTQTERKTLYAVRDFARFRKDFFVTIVTGQRAIPLPGNTGGAELAFLIRGERSPTVGFYRLLEHQQQVHNEQSIVRALRGRYQDAKTAAARGRGDDLNVTQLQSSLELARGRLLVRARDFANELDRFKVQLGLPPDMELTIDESLLEPFQFRDPKLTALEDEIRRYDVVVGAMMSGVTQPELLGVLEKLDTATGQIEAGFTHVKRQFDRLEQALPRRMKVLDKEQSEELTRTAVKDQEDFKQCRSSFTPVRDAIGALVQRLKKEQLTAEQLRDATAQTVALRDKLAQITRQLTGSGSRARIESIVLTPVNLTPAEVVLLAMENRLDLMNRRALVMDARRRIEIAADRLEGTVDVVVEGELNTPPLADNNRPFDFRAHDSSFRAGLAVTTPLDRRAERNDFRAAQVSYQRARRNYMTAKDQVKLDVRRNLRRAHMEATFFDVSRQALRAAVREYELAVERAEGSGEGAEQQGLNIPRALRNILEAQDDMIETWADYESARMVLFRDLGVMQIDENGVWSQEDQQRWAQ